MKTVIRAALFASIAFAMGALFGVCIAFFAREYAKEQVRTSRMNRKQYATITHDNGWVK